MKNTERYKLTGFLANKLGFTSYEAVDLTTRQNLIIRKYNAPISSIDFDELKKQILFLKNNPLENISKIIDFTTDSNSGKLIVTIEKPQGRPLSTFFKKEINKNKPHPFETTTAFLELAQKIINLINELHKKNILYLNIHPESIFIDGNDRVTAMPPSFSSFSVVKDPNSLNDQEGSFIYYLAPEQLGDYKEGIDFRTDFYSLGVLFYECLTGSLPFDDLTEIHTFINALISKNPFHINPSKVNSPIFQIISKLMAKSKENRYQSTFGINYDISRCMEINKSKKKLKTFTPGTRDIPCIFAISDKIYGRESELSRLLISFYKAAKGYKENIFIVGDSGIGKTKLISEFKRNVSEAGGIVISGVFTVKNQQIPYSAFKQAFSQFIREIISKGEEKVNLLKYQLNLNLKHNISIISNFIPEMKIILEDKVSDTDVSPIRNKNRFFTGCKQFLESCMVFSKPMVIFLDNLHLADTASLELFSTISKYFQGGPLLIIGAHRNLQNDSTEYLSEMQNNMKTSFTSFEIIELEALATHHIAELIQDSFGNEAGENVAFANLIFQQTGGNPFKIHQYLYSVHAEKLIAYDFDKGIWAWNFDAVYRKSRQNFPETYINKILSEFSDESFKLLATAACLGNSFSASKLAIIMNKSLKQIYQDLNDPFESGFIFQTSSKHTNNSEIYFRHDNIHQAIIEAMSPQEKQKLHKEVGERLYFYFKDNDIETLYEIVYHFDKGSEFLSKKEKYHVAELALKAAKNAIKSSSGSTALNFLKIAENLLGPDKWEKAPELSTQIYLEAGYSALISRDYDKVNQSAQKVLTKNGDLLSYVQAYELIINSQIYANELENAINSGIYILKKIGIAVNPDFNNLKNYILVQKTKILLTKNPVNRLKKLPKMQDKLIKTTMRILSTLLTPAYLSAPEIHPQLCALMIKLSLKHGYSPETPYGLAAFGISVCVILKNYDLGVQFGQASLDLGKRNINSKGYARTLVVNPIFLKHWKDPINSCLPMLRKGKEASFDIGDYEFASHAIQALLSLSLFAGHPITNINKELLIAEITLEQIKQYIPLHQVKLLIKFTKILLKETDLEPITTADILKDMEVSTNQRIKYDVLSSFVLNFVNYFIFFYMNDIDKADKYWQEADKYAHSAQSLIAYPYHLFVGAMIAIFKYEKLPKRTKASKKDYLKKIKNFKAIADYSPENHLHRYNIIRAELARLAGKKDKAEYFFQKAINEASEKDFTKDEAYFTERAYLFFTNNNKSKTAYNYLNAAIAAYRKWGCLLKVSDLLGSRGFTSKSAKQLISAPDFPLRTFPKIFRALRLLSEKMNKTELILQLMDILIEVSGGTHGYFIDIKDNIPYIKASITADKGPEYYDPGAGLSTFPEILEPVIHNVLQTRQTFYPEQISREYSKFFTPNAKKIPKSVICLPIIKKHILMGAIYLENIEIKNIFTQDKIEILTIIASHTAICLNNVDKYLNLNEKIGNKKQTETILHKTHIKLEERIRQRTQDLIKLNEKLQEEVEFKLKAEKELIKSETKYKTLVEKMNDGLGVQDKNGIITYVNDRMCKITGYNQNELVGKKAKEIIQKLMGNYKTFSSNARQKKEVFEQSVRTKDNQIVNVLFQGQLLYDNEGNYEGGFAVLTDITLLKKMAVAVQQREEQIRALLNATTDSVMMIDIKGKILTANNSAAKRFNNTTEEFIGKKIFNLFPENMTKKNIKYIEELIQTRKIVKFQDSMGPFIFDITLYPVIDNLKEVERIAVYAKDITELKKAEAQITSLTKEIIKAQENERRKIALDLHDHVAQNLSFLKITADSMKNTQDENVNKKISVISNGLKNSIEDIRHISYDLRPPNLDELGLAKAIYQHCEEFSAKYSIDIDFTSAGIENLDLTFDIKINIFRIIQEALNNVNKHSEATLVRIRLIASYPRIIFRIEDNGKGFTYDEKNIQPVSGKKMGLKGMRERINLIGGKMEIKTSPGLGTKIVAEIPYSEIKDYEYEEIKMDYL